MKYYVTKTGSKAGIYDNWVDCRNAMKGYINPICKSFDNLNEAELFFKENNTNNINNNLNNLNSDNNKDNNSLNHFYFDDQKNQLKQFIFDLDLEEKNKNKYNDPEKIYIYSNGDFNVLKNIYGYGIVILDYNDNKLAELKGKGNEPEFIPSRNIAGEITGALKGMEWAVANNYKKALIYYDYTGIGKWATYQWKAKSIISQYYIKEYIKYSNLIGIEFQQIKGHTNNYYNILADKLAKQGAEI